MSVQQSRMASGVVQKTLTHEVGAGAPCLKCGDKCPGLDLHFWRKICMNCKCKQENHDVLASVSTRGVDNIEKFLGNTRQISTRAKNSTSGEPTNSTPGSKAPPLAPKPAKRPSISSDGGKPTQNGNHRNQQQTTLAGSANIAAGMDKELRNEERSHGEPPMDNAKDLKAEKHSNFEGVPSPPLPSSTLSLSRDFEKRVTTANGAQSPKEIIVEDQHPPSVNSQITDAVAAPQVNNNEKDNEDMKYDWNPPLSDERLIKEYIDALPDEKRPIVGTEGAKYRKKQLMRQLPTHDQEPNECHDLTSQETEEMQLFVKNYRDKALGVANVTKNEKDASCTECGGLLRVGQPVVSAERMGPESRWHAGCFVCTECKELLVDLIYFCQDDKLYCGRHYCELQKPRCSACDELIFAPEYTQAEDCYWHLKHFCCWHCDQPLGGKNYVPHDNQPVCIPCYEKSFAHPCSTCKEIIAPNTEWVTFENHHWHAKAECFKCTQCGQSLVGKPCIPKGDMVFCCSKCKREKLPPT